MNRCVGFEAATVHPIDQPHREKVATTIRFLLTQTQSVDGSTSQFRHRHFEEPIALEAAVFQRILAVTGLLETLLVERIFVDDQDSRQVPGPPDSSSAPRDSSPPACRGDRRACRYRWTRSGSENHSLPPACRGAHEFRLGNRETWRCRCRPRPTCWSSASRPTACRRPSRRRTGRSPTRLE